MPMLLHFCRFHVNCKFCRCHCHFLAEKYGDEIIYFFLFIFVKLTIESKNRY
jgi:hypothetical protein